MCLRDRSRTQCLHTGLSMSYPRWVIQFAARTNGGPSPATAYANRTPSAARQNAMCWRGGGGSIRAPARRAPQAGVVGTMVPTNW